MDTGRWLMMGLIAVLWGALFTCPAQEKQDMWPDPSRLRSMNFASTALRGRVTDEAGRPVAGLRLELELAPPAELKNEINATGDQLDEILQQLTGAAGRGVFAIVFTDPDGGYRIKGVPTPGIFYLVVRDATGYFPTRAKVALDPSAGREFPVPDLLVQTRPIPLKKLSADALQAIDRSRRALAGNDRKTALAELKKALTLEPQYADGHYCLALLLLDEKKMPDALQSLDACLGCDPAFRPAYRVRGEIRFANRDYRGASDDLSRFAELNRQNEKPGGDDVRVAFLHGNACKALKRTEEAAGYFETYLALKERIGVLEAGDARILADLGGYYYGRKELDKAIASYVRAVQVDPAVGADAYLYLGNCHLARHEGKAAMASYRKYLERAPEGLQAAQVKAVLERLESLFPPATGG